MPPRASELNGRPRGSSGPACCRLLGRRQCLRQVGVGDRLVGERQRAAHVHVPKIVGCRHRLRQLRIHRPHVARASPPGCRSRRPAGNRCARAKSAAAVESRHATFAQRYRHILLIGNGVSGTTMSLPENVSVPAIAALSVTAAVALAIGLSNVNTIVAVGTLPRLGGRIVDVDQRQRQVVRDATVHFARCGRLQHRYWRRRSPTFVGTHVGQRV